MQTRTTLTRASALVAFVLSVAPLVLVAEPPKLISSAEPGYAMPISGTGHSFSPLISPDGRFVLFASNAGDLVTNDFSPQRASPWAINVFLRDRLQGTTRLVSVNQAGTGGGNGDSWPTAVSSNGAFALFESVASDLVTGDTNVVADVFLRDLVNGNTLLVSASTNGGPGNAVSRNAVMTPDARHVAFVSEANDLVAGDTNGLADVFVRDMETGATTLVSVGAVARTTFGFSVAGFTIPVRCGSESPVITPDGRYVAFMSNAGNLAPGVRLGGDVYVRDLANQTTVWASKEVRAALYARSGSDNSICFGQTISPDGKVLAYETAYSLSTTGFLCRYSQSAGQSQIVCSNTAVPSLNFEDFRTIDMTPDGRFITFVADTNGTLGATTFVCRWDAHSGLVDLVSGNLDNQVPTNTTCAWPAIDDSGRYVAFLTSATNLTGEPVPGDYHIYLRDTQSGATTLVDASGIGTRSALGPSVAPRLSADGQCVAFESGDANLLPNDFNKGSDVFVRDFAAGVTELISRRQNKPAPASGFGWSSLRKYCGSADGRYAVFVSDSDSLVPGDTNGCTDVFVRDLELGITSLVSVNTNGVVGNGCSYEPSMSDDGRFVAFSSMASDLVSGDTNNKSDVFVRNLQTGTTVLASQSSDGQSPGDGPSFAPLISRGGRSLAFLSSAMNLAAAPPGTNLFWRDLDSGQTFALPNSPFYLRGLNPFSMTPDGRLVALTARLSSTPCFYLWDSNGHQGLYTNQLVTTVDCFALSPDGSQIIYALTNALHALRWASNTDTVLGPFPAGSRSPIRFSGDGSLMVYTSVAALDMADTNGFADVYLHDFQSGSDTLISRAFTQGAADGVSDSPDITSDGRFIVYRSFATNIVPVDLHGTPGIFLYDRLGSITWLLSADKPGFAPRSGFCLAPVFGSDDRTVFFESSGSTLASSSGSETVPPRSADIFAVKIAASADIPPFSADISASADPEPGFWITWPVVSGRTYKAQFKSSLSDSDWQEVQAPVAVVGSEAYLFDPLSLVGRRFYRVIAR